jgi:protein CpxP
MRKINRNSLKMIIIAMLTTFFTSGSVLAQPGGMMHPGMNPEAAEQMMEYRQNYMGAGPGWMGGMMGGGYGCGGYGMGGYGMGYGMGGYGMGYGMGGYGMGHGMRGYMGGPMMGSLYGLNLTKEQRKKIRDLRKKLRQSNFKLMMQLMDETDKLYDLYSQETPNPKDVGKVYEGIFSVKRKMIENHIQERNSIYALLTAEQKKQFEKKRPYYGRHGMGMH